MDTSKQMPDLMGAGHRPLHGVADGNRRILAQLEHGPKASSRSNRPDRAWRLDGWTMGLVVLLLTIGGVAWLMHEEAITPVTFKRHADGGHSTAARSAQPPRNDDGERPAAIIDAPRLPVAAPHGTPAMALAATPAAPRTRAGATGASGAIGAIAATGVDGAPKALGAPRTPNLRATSAKVAKTSDQASVYQKTAALRGTLAPGAARTRPGSSSSPGHAATSDTDVTLLTALVAHAGKPASVAPERSRDVVERADGVPTADLLARCKQLGLMEGMLCRSRICAGSWESDPACRAPAQ